MTAQIHQDPPAHPRFPVAWRVPNEDMLSSRNWISIHIFYSSNQNPVILECIAPLVQDLKAQRLIDCYFFIKYWMEGPHVRLRLLPSPGVTEAEVKAVVEPVIETYLRHRPALFELDPEEYRAFHKQMFIAEYGEASWIARYGEDGDMPFRANNSYHYIEYEPEYDRYGGPLGVALAEWHFEHSSNMVIELLRSTNMRIRSILLGLSVQFTLPLCYGFMPVEETIITFFANYTRYWVEHFSPGSEKLFPEYEKKYQRAAPDLQQRIADIRRYVVGKEPGSLTLLEQKWLTHVRELRHRIDKLIDVGQLVFRGKGESGEPGPITREDMDYYQILLSSYIHMLNNRLGVSISDEIYLSYVMKRAIEDMVTQVEIEKQ